jgi:hypothetical protein
MRALLGCLGAAALLASASPVAKGVPPGRITVVGAWSAAAGGPALDVREIALETGLHHGFLYRPLPEWIEPVVEWSRR